MTLKEFIGMGDVTSMEDEERIKNAAKESGAHEIIMKLPDVSTALVKSLLNSISTPERSG